VVDEKASPSLANGGGGGSEYNYAMTSKTIEAQNKALGVNPGVIGTQPSSNPPNPLIFLRSHMAATDPPQYTREFDRHELMQSRGMDGPRHSYARKLIGMGFFWVRRLKNFC
jgi:hypothetical protein